MEGLLLDTMFDLPSLEGVEEVVISKEVVEGAARPLYDRGATRVHRSTKPCTACKTLIHHKAIMVLSRRVTFARGPDTVLGQPRRSSGWPSAEVSIGPRGNDPADTQWNTKPWS
jgi:hypothetical protein